jgi:S-adenosylmethionine hydrolase
VLASLAPQSRVIDITHGVTRHDVRAGAVALRSALSFMPPGVHLAVVDPAVGASAPDGIALRRAVAVRVATEERLLVGPDNGLLMLAAERLGGIVEAVDIGLSPHRLEPVSATFHGRDIFAPVAAALARDESLADAGEPLDAAELVTLTLPQPSREGDALIAHAVTIDRFGNVMLNADHDTIAAFGLKLGEPVTLDIAGTPFRARYARAFGEVPTGELLVYEDSHRQLAIAVNRGSAAARLGLRRDGRLRLLRAS